MSGTNIEIELALAVTLSELRTNTVGRTSAPEKFEALRKKHQDRLDEIKKNMAYEMAQCQAKNVLPEDSEEYLECIKQCGDCLDQLNKDCIGELADTSGKFITAISDAHSSFVEDLILLAGVYGQEENVDIHMIKEMFNNWYGRTIDSIRPYMTHKDLLEAYVGDELNNQIVRHENAAVCYNCTFVQDPTSLDYEALPAAFHKHNERNTKALQRSRDFLTAFAIMAFKNPWTWALVEFRKDGKIPERFIELTRNETFKGRVDVLINTTLKHDIAKLAGK